MILSVRIKFDKFLHDTGRAYLVRIGSEEYWLPSKLCRNLIVNKKLGGNLCIPTFLAESKGIEFNESDADVTVKHHVPEKIIAKPTDPDDSLTR